MKIIQANNGHLIEIMYLLRQCVDDFETNGQNQWDESDYSLQTLKSDIENKSLFIVKNNNISIATISLGKAIDNSSTNIFFSPNQESILSVALITIVPFWQRNGIGKMLIEFAEKYAIENGYSGMQINLSSNNTKAINFFNAVGFKKAKSYVNHLNNQQYLCFEKQLVVATVF